MPARILYLHGITMIGGAETDLLSLIGGLNREEFHPYVACPPEGPLVEELRSLHVPLCGLELPAWRKLTDISRNPIAVGHLVRLIHKHRIDLIHVNDFWWNPVAWLASRLTRRPCVVHIRQHIQPIKVKQYWLNKSDMLIAVSHGIKDIVLGAGVRRDRIKVAHSGIDFPVGFQQHDRIKSCYSLETDQPVIGIVAHLLPHKGYEYLIQAFGEVKKAFPKSHLLIVGDGNAHYRSELSTLIERLGLERAITFAGFQRKVFEYISAFDVFVLPSIYEAFGIALLEAMAMEKPIVASRVGGIPEIVVDGISGILVPPRDSGALASALLRLLQDEKVRREMGRAGRQRLETHFTRDGMLTVIQDIYAEFLTANKTITGPTPSIP